MGFCVLATPEVFDLDEDSMLQFEAHPDGDQADAVRDAVRTCPTNAIVWKRSGKPGAPEH